MHFSAYLEINSLNINSGGGGMIQINVVDKNKT
jgi:hypothetical protein